jgi:hypothetical protein
MNMYESCWARALFPSPPRVFALAPALLSGACTAVVDGKQPGQNDDTGSVSSIGGSSTVADPHCDNTPKAGR